MFDGFLLACCGVFGGFLGGFLIGLVMDGHGSGFNVGYLKHLSIERGLHCLTQV